MEILKNTDLISFSSNVVRAVSKKQLLRLCLDLVMQLNVFLSEFFPRNLTDAKLCSCVVGIVYKADVSISFWMLVISKDCSEYALWRSTQVEITSLFYFYYTQNKYINIKCKNTEMKILLPVSQGRLPTQFWSQVKSRKARMQEIKLKM